MQKPYTVLSYLYVSMYNQSNQKYENNIKYFNCPIIVLNMSSPVEQFQNIDLKEEAISYRDESTRCYSGKSFRATVTMAWCVLIYQIYKKIQVGSSFVTRPQECGAKVKCNL